MMRRFGVALIAVSLLLAGCATSQTTTATTAAPTPAFTPTHRPTPTPVSTDAAIQAVTAVVQARYDDVRSRDYAAACALYSDLFAQKFAELAGTDGSSCVAAHIAGQKNSDDYQATAKKQGRAGLTPFFYVPSAIRIDPSLISIEDNGTTAFLKPNAVVSLDPTKFEDGVGQVPSWIEGQDYLKLIDGHWKFIFMTEQ